jgi:trimeric autotransporter adhesin
MSRLTRLLTTLFLLSPLAISAQADILLQLRSGSPLGDRYRVDSAGGLVAIGKLGIGIIPASGAGYRMMWHPYKAAFRAGGTDDGGAGNMWDDANVGFYSWAGGNLTVASQYATFAFGDRSEAQSNYAVAFGNASIANGAGAFAMGTQSSACGSNAIGMGFNAHAGGFGLTCTINAGDYAIALGYRSTADADYSVAIGQRASTNGHPGAFVFADQSTTDSIEAAVNNEFAGRFAGGYRFRTNATLTTGCNLGAGTGIFTCSSTRNVKHGFLEVNGEDVLTRLSRMPVTSWVFDEDPSGARHLGPVAEDFRAAFGLGENDKTVGLNDLSGVALTAGKALEVRTRELKAAQAKLEETQRDLIARAAKLEERDRVIASLLARVEELERRQKALVTAP